MLHKASAALAVALLLSSGGHAAKPASPSPLLAKAKTIIAERMIDPASLQYRKLRIVRETVQGKALTVACGEYNSKNKLGGYTGFKTFAYEPTTLRGVMSFDGSDFDFFTPDGADFGSTGAFAETNARILAVCLGMKQ